MAGLDVLERDLPPQRIRAPAHVSGRKIQSPARLCTGRRGCAEARIGRSGDHDPARRKLHCRTDECTVSIADARTAMLARRRRLAATIGAHQPPLDKCLPGFTKCSKERLMSFS